MITSIKFTSLRVSSIKLSRLLRLVKGKSLSHSISLVSLRREASFILLRKLLLQCSHRFMDYDLSSLILRECWSYKSPSLKRIRPYAMGRSFSYKKHRASVTFIFALKSSVNLSE